MSDLLDFLLDLWLGAGILCFIAAMISAIFSRKRVSGPNPWVLPFYLLRMLPIYLAIYLAVAIWWLWEKLFGSDDK
jgi:ABC-type maltose transport system permease subunit